VGCPRITGDSSQRKRGGRLGVPARVRDDHSRLISTELLAKEKTTTSTCFLIRAAG
jgi:hypothetical protein